MYKSTVTTFFEQFFQTRARVKDHRIHDSSPKKEDHQQKKKKKKKEAKK